MDDKPRRIMTIDNAHALMLLIESLDSRLSTLETKLEAFYKNGISQVKTDVEVMNYSIQQMSQSLKAHLDWHTESHKRVRGIIIIITFIAGVLAGRLGPAVEAFVVKLFGLL